MIRHALLAVCVLLPTFAAADVAVPALKARVTDLTGTLSAKQTAQLEQRLAAFEREKGSQLAVLLLPTTQPETIEQYAIRVAEQWKLGRKGIDDGALLLIAKQDRALRIEVGYGLEGPLPDAIAKRIIDETVVPLLREGDYYGGIQAGVEQIIGVVSGEPLPPPARARESGGGFGDGVYGVLLVAALAIGQVLRAVLGRLPGALVVGLGAGIIVWLLTQALAAAAVAGVVMFAMVLMGLAGGGIGRSGGFRGGGGGGGFSGGGGGFGGGGASGRF